MQSGSGCSLVGKTKGEQALRQFDPASDLGLSVCCTGLLRGRGHRLHTVAIRGDAARIRNYMEIHFDLIRSF